MNIAPFVPFYLIKTSWCDLVQIIGSLDWVRHQTIEGHTRWGWLMTNVCDLDAVRNNKNLKKIFTYFHIVNCSIISRLPQLTWFWCNLLSETSGPSICPVPLHRQLAIELKWHITFELFYYPTSGASVRVWKSLPRQRHILDECKFHVEVGCFRIPGYLVVAGTFLSSKTFEYVVSRLVMKSFATTWINVPNE